MDSKRLLQNLETNYLLGKQALACWQNFIWLLNIPLYLPRPFIFLLPWHSQVQGQQWALITSKSYNCVVFIFEDLTLKSHTAPNNASIYNCLQETIQSNAFLTSENQTTCFTKSVKPNSIQRKRHQMALLKITILTFNFRYNEIFCLCFQSFRRTRLNLNFQERKHSFTPPHVSYDSQLLNLTVYQPIYIYIYI